MVENLGGRGRCFLLTLKAIPDNLGCGCDFVGMEGEKDFFLLQKSLGASVVSVKFKLI